MESSKNIHTEPHDLQRRIEVDDDPCYYERIIGRAVIYGSITIEEALEIIDIQD